MHILVAEDDQFFQKFYNKELTDRGFDVEIAENGVDAIEKLKAKKPDLVVLDIIMPKKNGFQVLEDIKSDSSLSGLPILVFSTLGQEKDVQRAMALGAKGYVNKSFLDIDSLVSKIKSTT